MSDPDLDDDRTEIDPAQLLTDVAAAAKERPVRDEIERYLDLEERVVFDWYDRMVPDGDGAADARIRHRRILNALDDHDRADDRPDDALRATIDEHVTLAERDLWAPLLAELDESGSDDLGRALQEARLSREEPDSTLSPPQRSDAAGAAEEASPGAYLVGLRDEPTEPSEPA